MAIIDHDDVRRRILGLSHYLDAIEDEDLDAVYDDAIEAATASFEDALQMCIEETVIKQDPEDTDVAGVDYDRLEPPMDWEKPASFDRLLTFQMRRRPIISVERIMLKLADDIPLIEFPAEWYEDHLQWHLGRVTLIPVALGDMVLSATGTPIYQWMTGRMPWPVLPQCLYINYTAGWRNAATDPAFSHFRRHLAVQAALYAMEDIQDLLPSSVSLDGASQTFDTVQQRLERRAQGIDDFLKEWKQKHMPASTVVL